MGLDEPGQSSITPNPLFSSAATITFKAIRNNMNALQQCYVVKDVPGKGMGMFATRDIKRGECILSEKPLVFATQDFIKTQLAVEAMAEPDKKSFFALHNVRPELPIALGIVKTNALPLGPNAVDCAVYKIMSRINHTCAPNVCHTWNSKTKKEYLHAIQDITAGSEILTSYLEPFMVRKDRMSFLRRNFKFECQCNLCAEPSPEYDSIVKRVKIYSDLIVTCATTNPKMSIQYVREVLAHLDKIGGEGKTPFYYDGYQISAMYGDYKFAQEWANLLLESYVLEAGKEGDRYERYLRYSKNPRSHERAGCAPRQILS
ncbi:hypothetical protein BGZ98_001521 [Dissophora globulifera]|nr:hypothetical protein BGZ98_001521 [Dissophora globulifera]